MELLTRLDVRPSGRQQGDVVDCWVTVDWCADDDQVVLCNYHRWYMVKLNVTV